MPNLLSLFHFPASGAWQEQESPATKRVLIQITNSNKYWLTLTVINGYSLQGEVVLIRF